MISTEEELRAATELSQEEEAFWLLQKSTQCLPVPPFTITDYYAGLINWNDPADPLRLQAVPRAGEFYGSPGEGKDPLAEKAHSPIPGVVHRYEDRVLLITTTACSLYCRHCFRRRLFHAGTRVSTLGERELKRLIGYVAEHKEVKEVILSGGDPFTLGPARLNEIMGRIRKVREDCVFRVAGRVPVVDPGSINEDMADVLSSFFPLWVMTQFNHSREITSGSTEAVARLREKGIPVMNQAVLLRGVNDTLEELVRLFQGLLRIGVKPYYLFQGDLAEGTSHFRVSLLRGLELYRELGKRLSGLALPKYAVDLPGGGGKVVLADSPVVRITEESILLRNPRGEVHSYPREDS